MNKTLKLTGGDTEGRAVAAGHSIGGTTMEETWNHKDGKSQIIISETGNTYIGQEANTAMFQLQESLHNIGIFDYESFRYALSLYFKKHQEKETGLWRKETC
jgi:hypothetical protein